MSHRFVSRRAWRRVAAPWLSALLMAGATAADSTSRLDTGFRVERLLHTSETHRYRLDAVAGELVHLRVDQRGIDVVVELYDAPGDDAPLDDALADDPDVDGAATDASNRSGPILTVDSRNRTHGPEEVWWIADATGPMEWVVRPFPGAAKGHYRLDVVARRPPTASDRQRAAAVVALHASRQGTEVDRHLADAIASWQATGERYQEALAWFAWADLAEAAGRYAIARDGYQATLGALRGLGETSLEIDALFELAGVLRASGDRPASRSANEQGLRLARREEDRAREATALNNLGLLHQNAGEWVEAVDHYRRALDIRRDLQDRAGRVVPLFNLGQTYSSLGWHREALATLHQARELAAWHDRRLTEITSLSEIGWIHALEGRFQVAETFYRQALAVPELSRHAEGGLWYRLGRLRLSQGALDAAEDFLDRAAARFADLGVPRDRGHALLAIAEMHLDGGRFRQAHDVAREALALFEPLGDRDGMLYARLLIGR
ncbi:MAG: tetratricopeptide repeat protein, partial [Acidobacteriota bacterium]